MPELFVRINGTDVNPFAKWGLTQNPFPQLARAETDAGERMIASLGGEPVKSEQDIRDRLKGCSEELIQACIERWTPGKMVEFKIHWPDA